MKLSFWMLGEPEWTIEEIVQRAADWGYQGVDLRVAGRDGQPQRGGYEVRVESTDSELARVARAFASAGVEVASLRCYMTSPTAALSESWPAFEQELARHARLAQAVGTTRIKVFADQQPPAIPWDDYLDRFWASVATGLDATPDIASVVIENHTGRANARQILSAAERAGDPRFGCAFSPTHALVMQEDTFALIDRYAAQIHMVGFADRAVPPDELGRYDGRYYHVRFELVKYGEGLVQAERLFAALAAHGFSDYVAYKCEESSHRGALLSASESLIAGFPAFVRELGAPVA